MNDPPRRCFEAVDPKYVEAMKEAFQRVCDVLRLEGNTLDTELVVLRIVELANLGELDPERLCIGVLASLESPDSPAHAASILRPSNRPLR